MTCKHDWTFRFPDVEGWSGPFEIRPISFTFRENRTEYVYCKAKFPSEVGDHMGYETRYDRDGKLRKKEIVELLHDGDVVKTLFFKPDFVGYGSQYTHLELQDPQKSMDTGGVDQEWEDVKLKEAYNYVWETYQNSLDEDESSLIEDIRFTDNIPDELATHLYGQEHLSKTSEDFVRKKDQIRAIEEDASKKLLETNYAVNFEKESPAKALLILNQKFNIQSWVDSDRILWIGYPEAANRIHIAAPDDERVWRYKSDEVNIKHPREPIKQVTVEGAWIDAPGVGTPEDLIDKGVSFFDSGHEGGFGDVKANGVAYRTDISYGKSILVSNTKAKKNSLPGIAEATMREMMKEGHSGSVEIDTELSGEFTRLHRVAPGDLIRLVPDDEFFANPTAASGEVGDEPENIDDHCFFVNNELYFIKEVQHNVDDDGHWSLTLDVGMYPDALEGNMNSALYYFDPSKDDYINEEQWSNQSGHWIEST